MDMGVLLIMQYICQKIGLASSAVILVGGALAYMSDGVVRLVTSSTGEIVRVQSPAPVSPEMGDMGLKWAGVAFVTAIGSIVTPIAAAWLKAKYDVRFALQAQRLKELESEVAKMPAIQRAADVAEERAHTAEVKLARVEAEVRDIRHTARNNTQRLDLGRIELDELHVGVAEARDEARLASLSPIATMVCGFDGIIIGASDQVSFLMQYSASELVGKSVKLMIPDYIHRAFDEALQSSLDIAAPMQPRVIRNFRALNKSGGNVFLDVRLTRWVDSGGNRRPPTREHIRFGALIREHRLGSSGQEPFPDVDLTGTIASMPDHP